MGCIPDTCRSLLVKEIEWRVFWWTDIESIVIGNNVERLNGAFKYCKSLKSVTFGTGLDYIGEQLFRESGIERIVIHKNIKEIDARAFLNCTSLKEVVLEDGGVEKICENAFEGSYWHYDEAEMQSFGRNNGKTHPNDWMGFAFLWKRYCNRGEKMLKCMLQFYVNNTARR